MGQLIYSAIASLDGYIEDQDGKFDWAAPDEEVHSFVNDLERPVGTYLYGRRMYETMLYWRTPIWLRTSLPFSRTSRLFGRRRGRSCIREHSHRSRALEHGSKETSTPKWSAS